MKKIFKDNWKFLLFVLLGGLIGGYFLGVYSYDSLSPELLKELKNQNITKEIVIFSTIIQYAVLYGLLLASIGIVLSKKIKILDDNDSYLGNQVECKFNCDEVKKYYGIVANMDFILVSEYEEGCINPEIIIYKKR